MHKAENKVHHIPSNYSVNINTLSSLQPAVCTNFIPSPALCWCTDFLFRKEKPVCYAGEFQRKGDKSFAARLSLCYNSADKTTDPYLQAESALPSHPASPTRVMHSAEQWHWSWPEFPFDWWDNIQGTLVLTLNINCTLEVFCSFICYLIFDQK